MVRTLLLMALAFALGALGGWGSRRILLAPRLPEPRRRPPVLREAMQALERGAEDRLAAALAAADAAPLDREARAELRLLEALAADDLRALLRVRQEAPGTRAAARASWEAIRRTSDEALRRRREADFRRRHPDAWVWAERDA